MPSWRWISSVMLFPPFAMSRVKAVVPFARMLTVVSDAPQWMRTIVSSRAGAP